MLYHCTKTEHSFTRQCKILQKRAEVTVILGGRASLQLSDWGPVRTCVHCRLEVVTFVVGHAVSRRLGIGTVVRTAIACHSVRRFSDFTCGYLAKLAEGGAEASRQATGSAEQRDRRRQISKRRKLKTPYLSLFFRRRHSIYLKVMEADRTRPSDPGPPPLVLDGVSSQDVWTCLDMQMLQEELDSMLWTRDETGSDSRGTGGVHPSGEAAEGAGGPDSAQLGSLTPLSQEGDRWGLPDTPTSNTDASSADELDSAGWTGQEVDWMVNPLSLQQLCSDLPGQGEDWQILLPQSAPDQGSVSPCPGLGNRPNQECDWPGPDGEEFGTRIQEVAGQTWEPKEYRETRLGKSHEATEGHRLKVRTKRLAGDTCTVGNTGSPSTTETTGTRFASVEIHSECTVDGPASSRHLCQTWEGPRPQGAGRTVGPTGVDDHSPGTMEEEEQGSYPSLNVPTGIFALQERSPEAEEEEQAEGLASLGQEEREVQASPGPNCTDPQRDTGKQTQPTESDMAELKRLLEELEMFGQLTEQLEQPARLEQLEQLEQSVESEQLEQTVELVQTEELEQLVQTEELEQLVQTEELEQLIQTEELEQLVHTEELEQLVQTEELEQLIQTEELEQLIQTEELEQLVQSEELEQLVQTEELEQLVHTEELEQLVQTKEFEQLVQTVELEQLVQSEELEQLVQTEELEQLVQTEELEQLIQTEELEQLVQSEELEQLVQSDELEQLIQTVEFEQLVQTEELEQLVQTEELEQLIQTEELEQLVQTKELEQLVQTEELEQLVQTEELEQLVQSEELEQLVQSEELEQLIQTVEFEQLIQTEELEQLVQTEELEQLVQTKELEQLVQTEELEQLVQTEELEQLIQTEELEQLVQTKELEQLVQTEELEQLIQTEELEQLIHTEELEQLVQTEELEQPVQLEQLEQLEQSVESEQLEQTVELVQTEELEQLVQTEELEQLLQTEELEKLVQTEELEQPVQLEQLEQLEQSVESEQLEQTVELVQTEELEQLVQTEELEQLVQTEELEQPARLEQLEQLEQSVESEQLEQTEELEQLVQTEELEQLVQSEELEQLVQTEELEQLIQTEELEQLVQTEELEQLVQTEELEQLVQTEELEQLVQTEELEQLVQTVELEQLVQTVELEQLVQTVELEQLVQTEELEQLVQTVELEQLVQTVELEQLVQTVELEQLVQTNELEQFVQTVDLEQLEQTELEDELEQSTEQHLDRRGNSGQREQPLQPEQLEQTRPTDQALACSPPVNDIGVDREGARRLAEKLHKLQDVRRTDVVRHMDKDNEFSRTVGQEYLKFFDFTGQTLDQGLRSFLKVVVLIGESQERARVLQHFAERFQDCNPDSFSSSEAVLKLTSALMLLNTDLHGQNVDKPMSSSCFVSNLDGMDEGESFHREMLKALYSSIKREPLQWAIDEEELKTLLPGEAKADAPTHWASNPFQDIPHDERAAVFKEGFLTRKAHADIDGKRTPWGKRSWKTFYAVLKGLVLYLMKDQNSRDLQSAEEVVSVHHSLAEPAFSYTKRPHVLRLQTADWRVYLLQTVSAEQVSSWMCRMNLVSALYSSPPFPAAVGSQRKFSRPTLPSKPSPLTLENKLQSHSRMLQSFSEDLRLLQQELPNGRRSKTRELEEHRQREEYLQHEKVRYEVYLKMLKVWQALGCEVGGPVGVDELKLFDREVRTDAGEEQQEAGLRKSYSTPSLVQVMAPPTEVKIKRNISERRTYRKVIIPRRNRDV
ncbi:hypothetical protein SKAU_G00283120 [Synaphobranchus kaupii]|uniref:PH and SEC7 domain-containing protein 4 n=1 Tax=Synaphobranchus kaupii TaxID=118154 RepID=A0A9Q1EXH7_SYNKA|nr:hypothetical protein SKAU_G00283120 [Synaphobranchus kaupii]